MLLHNLLLAPPGGDLRAFVALRRRLDAQLDELEAALVRRAVAAGRTWTEIGLAAGYPEASARSSAQRRWGKHVGRRKPGRRYSR